MVRRLLVVTAVLCLAILQQPAPADEPKTADEVVARYIKAIGGREKVNAIKTLKCTGKSVFAGGMEVPLTMEFKRPNKVRLDMTMQGMTAVQAFDGTAGWFVMPFAGRTEPEKMSADQLRIMEGQADFDGPLVDYQKKGHAVELAGKEEAEGSAVYKLKVTKKGGNVEYHFLDAQRFLPTKIEGKQEFQGTQIEYQTGFSDYKDVAGMLFPHSVRQKAGQMGESTMVFEKVEANVPIDEERFVMPKPKPGEPGKEATPPTDAGKPEDKSKPGETKKP